MPPRSNRCHHSRGTQRERIPPLQLCHTISILTLRITNVVARSSCTLCDASVVRADEPPANVTLFPVKPKKAAPRDESVFVCIVERRTPEREFLMVQRPAEGLLASLWEFPSLILPSAASSVIGRAHV